MDPKTQQMWAQIFLYILVVIILLGITANLLLIVMFFRHKVLRTGSNVLILNLAIADLFHISVNGIATFLVFQRLVVFSDVVCKIEESFRTVSVGVSVWSVVALSIHRYKIISSMTTSTFEMKRLAKIFVLAVWIFVMAFTLPVSVQRVSGNGNKCATTLDVKFVSLYSMMLYSVIPLVIIVVMYILTARMIKNSAETMPGERMGQESHRNARIRGARVLISLTVVFAISYLPLFIMIFVNAWFKSPIAMPFLLFGALCHFISSVANPVALFVSSLVFRTYFKNYFTCSCALRDDEMNGNVSRLVRFMNSLKFSSSDAQNSTSVPWTNRSPRKPIKQDTLN